MTREPLVTVASVTAIAAAVLGLVTAFVPLDDGKQAAILGVAAVAAPFIVAAVARPKVTPVTGAHRGEGGFLSVSSTLPVETYIGASRDRTLPGKARIRARRALWRNQGGYGVLEVAIGAVVLVILVLVLLRLAS